LTAAEKGALEAALRGYRFVVSTEPREGALVVGEGTTGKTADPATAAEVRKTFEDEMKKRGWLE
jgi:hypothetical protein